MQPEDLIEMVTRERAASALQEVCGHYIDATVSYEVRRERGIITARVDRYVVSKEFVETELSLSYSHRLMEYARILQAKARLVVIVPKDQAVRTRMRLLELNNWWLCYYQMFYYGPDGEISRMDRRTWHRLMGLPRDGSRASPNEV